MKNGAYYFLSRVGTFELIAYLGELLFERVAIFPCKYMNVWPLGELSQFI